MENSRIDAHLGVSKVSKSVVSPKYGNSAMAFQMMSLASWFEWNKDA